MDQLVVPELISKKAAGFQKELPIQEGRSHHTGKMRGEFAIGTHEIMNRRLWTMTIGGILGQDFRKTGQARIASPDASSPRIDKFEFGVRKPVFVALQIQPVNELPSVERKPAENVPAPLLMPAALMLYPRNCELAPAAPGACLPMVAAASLPELRLEAGARAFAAAGIAIPELVARDCAREARGVSLGTRVPGAAAPVHIPVLELALAETVGKAPEVPLDVQSSPHSSAGWMRSPTAEPAARFVEPSATVAPAFATRTAAPQIAVTIATARKQPDDIAGWMRSPAAEPAARFVEPSTALAPIFAMRTATPPIAGPIATARKQPDDAVCLGVPGGAPGWMRLPVAEAAARLVLPAMPEALPLLPRIAAPAIGCLKVAGALEAGLITGWLPAPAPEAAARFVQPLMPAARIQWTFDCAAPDLEELHVLPPDLPFITQWMEPSEAEMVEDEVHAKWRGAAIAFRPAEPVLPSIIQLFSPEDEEAALAGPAQGPAADPVESMPNAGGARLVPISTLEIEAPVTEATEKRAAVPHPGLVPMDYFCQRLRSSSPHPVLSRMASEIGVALQPFAMQPAQEKLENLTKKPEPKAEPAKVVTLPQAKVRTNTLGLDRTAKIAACLLAAAFLWLGFRSGLTRSSNTTAFNSIGSASDVSSENASGRVGTSASATGTMARLRRAIANRASVEMTDSFRNGMENWGAAPKSWARGWSRHPDGYVRTGELALFAPSSAFTNYRLEFYGQIESKSMGWVVRAKDRENYYAMKFTVTEPGVRPVIALTHYPVVGGRRGQKVTTPLNVMVHNNQPYHVSVDVRGNRFTTSIEGEQIGSWTDTTLSAGGIGFFSEAGERARLYWMKVSKNQDWLGRFCEYLAGEGGNTAELWRSRTPGPKPEPVRPAPAGGVLAAEFESKAPGLQRARASRQERINIWNS